MIHPLHEDPLTLITFDGLTPVPTHKRGEQRRRAQVTIDLLQLDTREELLRGRAQQIVALYMALNRQDCAGYVQALLSDAADHASCTRAFHALCVTDGDRAKKVFEDAREYVESQSP